MNKLKTFKYKTNSADPGFLDKISKRYSTYRFLRKAPGRKNSGTPQPISASYNMTGHESEDHKVEIGAPVLISKTTIDSDHEVVDGGDSHSHINDGVRVASNGSNTAPVTQQSFGELKFSFFTPQNNDENDQDYDIPRPYAISSNDPSQKPIRSKSATNLHRTEVNICLQRAPSLKLLERSDDAAVVPDASTIDDPEPVPLRKRNNQSLNNVYDVPVPNGSSTPVPFPRSSSKSSLNRTSLSGSQRFSKSRDSVAVPSSICDEDFDLKSASCHSLNARDIFLSIEELNDITKQINEADELKLQDDGELEYCEHRDNLRPVERRITLLRNKNHRIVNIGTRRDKITNAWSGFKSWIGEEKGKIRNVVHRHAALQRVGANFKNRTGSSTTSINDASASTDATTEPGNSIVRNQDFFDRVRSSTADSSNDVSNPGDRKLSTGNDSTSEFSSLDGDCRRKDSLSNGKSSDDRTDTGYASQLKGRPSKDSWEVMRSGS